MIDPLVSRAIAAGFALLLLLAAWHKVAARPEFVAAVGDYRLLPDVALPLAGLLLPCIEVLLGLAWLAGYAPGAVAWMTAALLGLYAAAIAINLRRGRVHISCGCGFGGTAGRDPPLSWWLVARNLLLGAVALLAVLPPAGRELGGYDWLTLVLALLASLVLYAGGSQLLRNAAAMATWRKARD